MLQYPFTASPHSIALFFRGKMRNVPSTDPSFPELFDHLKLAKHDEMIVERLVDKPTMIERLLVGEVRVVGTAVYYKDTLLHTTLTDKLLSMLDAGFDATNWARFLSRVMENPSERSRECLFDFLKRWNAPITEDGCFIAFKRVRGDFRDIYSGTMDNSPGQIVEMERDKVNDNPNVSCSYGLHVCATPYLGSYHAGNSTSKVLACKVDPVDVVAVPTDYNGAKMRVCKYLVLGVAEEEFVNNATTVHVYNVSSLVQEALRDLTGRRVCSDAVTFSEDWKRDIHAEIVEGTTVAPTAYSGDELPPNKFMVGVVTASSKDDNGHFVDVSWQDGGKSETLLIDRLTPLNSDVVAVTYIGEEVTNIFADDGEEGDGENIFNDGVEDDDYCDMCGDDSQYSGGLCYSCHQEEEEEERARWQETVDAVDEADHIAETGLTRAGEPVSLEEQRAAARYLTPLTPEDAAYVPSTISEKAFTKDGVTHTASSIKAGVEEYGQRGYARITGIPRTTIQEWLKAID